MQNDEIKKKKLINKPRKKIRLLNEALSKKYQVK